MKNLIYVDIKKLHIDINHYLLKINY